MIAGIRYNDRAIGADRNSEWKAEQRMVCWSAVTRVAFKFPLPANVVMISDLASTLRIRLFRVSEMYRLFCASRARPIGHANPALLGSASVSRPDFAGPRVRRQLLLAYFRLDYPHDPRCKGFHLSRRRGPRGG